MNAREAGELAAQWVHERETRLSGFAGAYLSGSYLTAGEEEPWPISSDVDIVEVFSGKAPLEKPGKFLYRGLLLEVTYLSAEEFRTIEHVLSTHYLAYAMNAGKILSDPYGRLARVHEETVRRYGERRWVWERVQSFLDRIRREVPRLSASASLPEQVNGWLFPTGIACFPILAAALENCTVRKRFTAARRVLEQYGMAEFYPQLLRLLAPERLSREKLAGHLAELEKTFALAGETRGPSERYPFRKDISRAAAGPALEGCRELIFSAWPEESAFWMCATFARCHSILQMDEPGISQERLPAFCSLLRDLGIYGFDDLRWRSSRLLGFLPQIEETARKIVEKREFSSQKNLEK